MSVDFEMLAEWLDLRSADDVKEILIGRSIILDGVVWDITVSAKKLGTSDFKGELYGSSGKRGGKNEG